MCNTIYTIKKCLLYVHILKKEICWCRANLFNASALFLTFCTSQSVPLSCVYGL